MIVSAYKNNRVHEYILYNKIIVTTVPRPLKCFVVHVVTVKGFFFKYFLHHHYIVCHMSSCHFTHCVNSQTVRIIEKIFFVSVHTRTSRVSQNPTVRYLVP